LKGAASTTQKLAPAIVANAVNNATQSVMKSMNMGGVEAVKDLKKQQDNEKTKDAGKEAEARIKTMKEEQQKLTDEKKKLDEETKNSIEEAKREHSQKIQEAEKDLLDANTGIQQYQSSIDQRKIQADQLKVIIDASKNINNLQMAQNPNHISTTAAEEAQLQQLIDSTTEDEASLMALLHEKDATNNIIRDTKTALNTEITDISDRGKAERKAIEDKVTASKETVTKLQDAVKAMNKVLKDEKGGSLDGKFKDLEKEIKASKTP